MRPLESLVLALLLIIGIVRADFDSDYAECRDDEHFGTEKLVCDPDHHLAPKTVNKLTALLTDLQTRITCTCEGGCRRADGRDGYIGLIQITDSKKFTDLATSTKQAYENAHLGNATCKHGLYIVYIHDTKKLATYRGGDSFVILSDEDMKKLHELAKKGSTGEGDEQALAYLLANYNEDVAKASVAQRAESWTPVIGLVIAILIILLIIALLLLLFLCRWCCGDRSRTKEIYHVNDETLQNYKTIEPIYIATPPHRSPDGIYSTPYSGSPLPFPPPPGTSGPVTPTSTYRTRITPLHGPLPPAHLAGSPYGPPGLFGPPGPLGPPGPRGPPSLRGGPGGPILLPPPGAFPPPGAYSQPPSHVDTPASRRRGRPERRPTLPISSGDREPVRRTASDISRPIPVAAAFAPSLRPPPGPPGPFGPPVPFGGPPFGGPAGPISPSSFSPRSPDANSLQPSVISEQDLFFLDPKRKLETQTKEDFIS